MVQVPLLGFMGIFIEKRLSQFPELPKKLKTNIGKGKPFYWRKLSIGYLTVTVVMVVLVMVLVGSVFSGCSPMLTAYYC